MASFVRKLSLLKNGLTTRTTSCNGVGCSLHLLRNNYTNLKHESSFCSQAQAPVVNDTKQNYKSNMSNEIAKNEEPQSESDVLYKRLEVEVRGHDAAVLKSYEWFATTAAKHLGITVSKTWIPPVFKIRRRALKSAFVHGKHIVQYEFRTYFRIMEFIKLTGSTADTYLEYIQRNLPEGVAMKVTRERIEKIPPHIRPPSDSVH